MHLPRHTIESHAPVPLFSNAAFSSPTSMVGDGAPSASSPSSSPRHLAHSGEPSGLSNPSLFACATSTGFLVAQCEPLKVVARRNWSASQGGLAHAVPVQHSSLLVLVGGGRVPRFAPNKVVLWDEAAEVLPDQRSSRSAGKRRATSGVADTASEGTLSRQASTVFSAGSKFDSVLHTGASGFQREPSLGGNPDDDSASASPPDSLRFSRSSLVDGDDFEAYAGRSQQQAPRDPPPATAAGYAERPDPAMEASFGGNSIGIGRLQRGFDPEPASHKQVEAEVGQSMYSSQHPMRLSSASIMASSANLDDPFAFDESGSGSKSRTPSPPPPPDSRVSHVATPGMVGADHVNPQPPSASLDPSSPCSGSFPASGTSSLSASAISTSSQRSTGSTADATAPEPSTPKARAPVRGREVAELEFGELVRGVRIATVADSGKISHADGQQRPRISTFLLVLLSSKAIVFELSHRSTNGQATGGWTIAKRIAVSTYKNVHGLGAAAACSHGSAIVAVPGRQKGHVQTIHIRASSSASDAPDRAYRSASSRGSSGGASTIIVAHESSIAAIALSPCGRLLATASSKGTILRIWSSVTGAPSDVTPASTLRSKATPAAGRTGFGAVLVRELRRGTDPARILGIAFAPDASAVAAASDKGTVHIFQLADLVDGPSGRSSAPTSSSSSSEGGKGGGREAGTGFGSAASKFLPSGLGQLANHIPASMLPQYFRSEWSGAQFRVPLKTFGADSRAPSSMAFFGGSEAEADSDGDGGLHSAQRRGGSEGIRSFGTEKSTDGAWAAMKGRLEDIRKGEPGVDEKIFLCWVVLPEEAGAAKPATGAPASVKAERVRSGAASRAARDGSGRSSAAPSPAGVDRERFRLILLTTSGAWYKLALVQASEGGADGANDEAASPAASSSSASAPGASSNGSMVLDMYRSDSAQSRAKSGAAAAASERARRERSALSCKLEEFRRFGESVDGWEF
ncbi:Phosphatidylinositol 3,5-bisphosphate-binding protein [Thecaphora frezii]